MVATGQQWEKIAFWLAWSSAAAAVVSIAASQILLGATLAILLLGRVKLRVPPVGWLVLAFMAGTLVSLAVAGEWRQGWPQLRKFYVWTMLIAVASTFRYLWQVRLLFLTWMGAVATASLVALVQFARKWEAAERLGENFYLYYVGERISGFMSHWMTFGAHGMIVLLGLVALVIFVPGISRKTWIYVGICAVLLGAGLVLGFTRSVWLGALVGGIYLVGAWRPKLLLLLPVTLVVGFLAAPESVRSRVISSFRPHGETDSNQHRVVCWRTGWEMIKAHPVVGVGPEQVGPQLMSYLPEDIHPPLPEGYYGHLHSIYVHYAAERGIPVLLILLAMLGKMIVDWRRALKRSQASEGERKFVLHAGVATVLAVLVSGIFELNLGDSEVLAVFLSIVSCSYLAAEQPKKEVAVEA
jgi:putative inorganic carbon (hco3(-)) transporter